jgi:predicted acyltransferase
MSLDFFRGLTMFLLIGEATHIYSLLLSPPLKGTILEAVGHQFHHHPWAGLRFWDLVQPFFMLSSASPRLWWPSGARGESRARITRHVVIRALTLLLLGWALYCIGPGRITFRFQNVLAQLGVTYPIAYFLMRRRPRAQVGWSFFLIILTETIYRTFWVPGYNQPFVPDHNFGSWFDMLISGELSSDHWVSFNAIPTAAHTIWGVLAGQLLRSGLPPRKKVRTFALAGLAGVAAGFALTPVSPMIKRICTSSFVLAGGGFCLLALALSYWAIDVLGHRKGAIFFNVVGLNPIFIYLFQETGGARWLDRLARPFTTGFFGWTGALPAEFLTSAAVWAMMWLMCFYLYKKKICIRI